MTTLSRIQTHPSGITCAIGGSREDICASPTDVVEQRRVAVHLLALHDRNVGRSVPTQPSAQRDPGVAAAHDQHLVVLHAQHRTLRARCTARRHAGISAAADAAYRRAWWSLALYPISFVAAFAVGEGILSAVAEGSTQATSWQVLLAATPALIVFVVPVVLSVSQGRKAMRLGRTDGNVPATVGATIAIGFVSLNVASYLLGLVAG